MGTNADTGSDAIRDTWKRHVDTHENALFFENLGSDSYLYMVKHAIALVGNSSSGIIEAPSLGVATVNIGHRQDGRVYGNSVFHTECRKEAIAEAMRQAVSFAERKEEIENPYYQPDTAKRYCEKTMELLRKPHTAVKVFYDLPRSENGRKEQI